MPSEEGGVVSGHEGSSSKLHSRLKIYTMRKQTIIGFWYEVAVAFLLLAAIVVVGVLSSGCVVKKNGKSYVTLDGETFNPVIEHSQIK